MVYHLFIPIFSTKTKHLRKNESLYLEKMRSKENTLRNEDIKTSKKKPKAVRNNSKSYIKVNGFDKIIDTIRTGTKQSKERIKNFSKIDCSLNIDKFGYSKSKNNNLLNNQYMLFNMSRAPMTSMSTKNLSQDKTEQSVMLNQKVAVNSIHYLKNYNIFKNSQVTNSCPETTKVRNRKRHSLVRSKRQPSQKDL
jgi:hypothetical protein